ncbi:Exocyst complex component 5 [Homalodisca vitripennis]|nr:Exocyst complex component 5 [Homalodisca vitripennis]
MKFPSGLTDRIETKSLKEKCITILNKYYESKGHQKKQLQVGGFQDLRRDLQAVIGTRANINIAQIEDYGGETFLSEEMAIALLQETKLAFQRCQLLSQQAELADNAARIMDVLLDQLITEHVEYAIELGLQAVPIPETKTQQPQVYFFNIVSQANAVIHLVEKQFSDSLIPIVISTPKHGECLQMKKRILDPIETKLDTGLDR